jgi:GNAT superfamily N-acetyltransferase
MNEKIEIRPLGPGEIAIIQQLSNDIWKKVYTSIISIEQIEYMLDLIYNEDALSKQIHELHHSFILVLSNKTPIGYASFSMKSPTLPGVYRLHKLYLQPTYHGKGIGKAMMDYIIRSIQPLGANALELNVNKYNPALSFYKKLGFSIDSETIIDIGKGYVMDDYVMKLEMVKYPL